MIVVCWSYDVLIEEKHGEGCCFYISVCMAVLARASLLKFEQMEGRIKNRTMAL